MHVDSGAMAVIQLPNHSHCLNCGDPVTFGEEYCNENCKSQHMEDEKKTRRSDIIFYGIIAVAILALVYVAILG